jgi:hypothetical protein
MTVDPRRPVDELRAMSDRMRQLEDRIERLAAPSGTQSLRAVSLLNQLRTYSQRRGFAFQNGAGTTNYTNPAAVTFTVDRPMRVLLQLAVPIAYVVDGGDEVQAFLTYALTGPGAAGSLQYLFRTGTPSGENGANQGFAVAVGAVGAGTHTFAPESPTSATLLLSGGSAGIHFASGLPITAIVVVTGEVPADPEIVTQ